LTPASADGLRCVLLETDLESLTEDEANLQGKRRQCVLCVRVAVSRDFDEVVPRFQVHYCLIAFINCTAVSSRTVLYTPTGARTDVRGELMWVLLQIIIIIAVFHRSVRKYE
jgi:hypothetical protein